MWILLLLKMKPRTPELQEKKKIPYNTQLMCPGDHFISSLANLKSKHRFAVIEKNYTFEN